MDEYSSSRFEGLVATVKRKRSQTSRRPRPESQGYPLSHDRLFSFLLPVTDDANKVSSNEVNGDAHSKRKTFNLNQCLSRGSSLSRAESDYPYKRTKEDEGLSESYGNGDMGDGIDQALDAPSRHSRAGDGAGYENKLKKVKLKVGGVTCTIQTISSSSASGGG